MTKIDNNNQATVFKTPDSAQAQQKVNSAQTEVNTAKQNVTTSEDELVSFEGELGGVTGTFNTATQGVSNAMNLVNSATNALAVAQNTPVETKKNEDGTTTQDTTKRDQAIARAQMELEKANQELNRMKAEQTAAQAELQKVQQAIQGAQEKVNSFKEQQGVSEEKLSAAKEELQKAEAKEELSGTIEDTKRRENDARGTLEEKLSPEDMAYIDKYYGSKERSEKDKAEFAAFKYKSGFKSAIEAYGTNREKREKLESDEYVEEYIKQKNLLYSSLNTNTWLPYTTNTLSPLLDPTSAQLNSLNKSFKNGTLEVKEKEDDKKAKDDKEDNLEKYKTSDWEDVKPEENSEEEEKTRIYNINGVRIRANDTEKDMIKVNKKTGEIAILNGENIKIESDGKNKANLIIENSYVSKIALGENENSITLNNSIVDDHIVSGANETLINNNSDVSETRDSLEETYKASESCLEQNVEQIMEDLGIEKTNLTPEEQVQILALGELNKNLNFSKEGLEAQDNKDGDLREGFNFVKELTDLGVSRKDVENSIDEQERIINDLKEAFLKDDGSFEAKYKEELGVEYKAEDIEKFVIDQTLFNVADAKLKRATEFTENIKQAKTDQEMMNLFLDYYGSEEKAEEGMKKFFNAIGDQCTPEGVPVAMYDTDISKIDFKKGELYTTTTANAEGYKEENDGKEQKSEGDTLVNLLNFNATDADFSHFTNEVIKETNYKELQENYAKSQKDAYGDGIGLQKVINKYAESQDGFIQTLSTINQVANTSAMVVGGVLCCFGATAPVGATMMTASKYANLASMLIDPSLEAADGLTSKDGLSEEEAKALVDETIKSAMLYVAGNAIGKFSNSISENILQTCKEKGESVITTMIKKYAAEIGTDACLSLATDLAITGEIDLTSEGFNQLLGIITGVGAAKADIQKAKINTDTKVQDVETTKTTDTKRVKTDDSKTNDSKTNDSNPFAEAIITTDTKAAKSDNSKTDDSNPFAETTKSTDANSKINDADTKTKDVSSNKNTTETDKVETVASDTKTDADTKTDTDTTKTNNNDSTKQDVPDPTDTKEYIKYMLSAKESRIYTSDNTLIKILNNDKYCEQAIKLIEELPIGNNCEWEIELTQLQYGGAEISAKSSSQPSYANPNAWHPDLPNVEAHMTLYENYPHLSQMYKEQLATNKELYDAWRTDPLGRTHIYKTITVEQDGTIKKSTTTKNNTEITTWYRDGYNSNFFTAPNSEVSDFTNQIEITYDKDGAVEYLIHTKPSDTLSGAYETTKYNLNDYPDDFDIKQHIIDGTIDEAIQKQGLPKGLGLEKVYQNADGSTSFVQNYEINGNRTARCYEQKTNVDGSIASTTYVYQITDANGNKLLDLKKSWSKDSNNQTTTIINDKKYVCNFDDKAHTISVTKPDGSTKKINLEELVRKGSVGYDAENKKVWSSLGQSKEVTEEFYNYCKELQADTLLSISEYYSEICIIDNPTDAMTTVYSERLYMAPQGNSFIIGHEIGHNKDHGKTINDGANNIQLHITAGKDVHDIGNTPEIYNTYLKEIKNFEREYPEEAQKIINYFSRTGGSTGTGLGEIIAEVNGLMTTYGSDSKRISARTEYLVKYFPETIAKIAKLLGY